jgi:sulfoxide reductase heme-binding subunit YedZ
MRDAEGILESDLSLRSLREPKWFFVTLIVLCCVPAVLASGAMASDIIAHTRHFGSNPVKEGEHFLGEWTLRFIIASLAVTPLRQVTGWNWLAKHRRTLGLFAFGYLMLHWLTYALLDVQLNWGDLVKDLTKRPYIMIGMAALLLMIPLALTSTRNSIRRLGGKRWNRLHMLIYPIAILGVIHFWLGVKKDITDPLLYGVCVAALLGWRVVRWWSRREAPHAATLAGAP